VRQPAVVTAAGPLPTFGHGTADAGRRGPAPRRGVVRRRQARPGERARPALDRGGPAGPGPPR